ncbi:MAG: phytanoyl-CoA dioxygenase family protein [Chitinophagales bacterium]
MFFLENLFASKQNALVQKAFVQNAQDALDTINEIGFAVIPLLDIEKHQLLYKESESFIGSIMNKIQQINFLSLGRCEDHKIINDSKDIIEKHLSDAIYSFFDPEWYEVGFGTHLLKENNKDGMLNPHQDSSHVDEHTFNSFHLWIPITPPSRDFGTLEVIPFSHKLNIPYRSLNIPWALREHEKTLWKFMQKVHLEAGQAVVFDSRLIHASGLNKSDKIRIAANCMIKPKQADMIHFYSDAASDFKLIELYKINPSFYYNENIIERPNGYPLLSVVENTNQHYTLKELKSIFLS